jgi:hypothetical protein
MQRRRPHNSSSNEVPRAFAELYKTVPSRPLIFAIVIEAAPHKRRDNDAQINTTFFVAAKKCRA